MAIESVLDKLHTRLQEIEQKANSKEKLSQKELDDLGNAIKQSYKDLDKARSLKDTQVNPEHANKVTQKIKKSLANIVNFIHLQTNPSNQQQAGFLQTNLFLKVIADFQDSLKNLETEMDKRKVKKVSGDPLDKQ